MTPILVTGAEGQLGTELVCRAVPAGWTMVAVGRHQLDLADPSAIAALMAAGHAGYPWMAVINAAAFTAVDKAEDDVVTAWAVNALAPAALGTACAAAGIPLIHVSTDYVFAGDKDGDWSVDDSVAPLNVYGASKLGGELAVRTSGARHAIVRTAWVISAHGRNFVKTMLRAAGERDHVRVVDDQRGSPTSATDLAEALVTITRRLVDNPTMPSSTVHFTNAGAVSWAGLAAEIFRQSGMRGGPVAVVEPIATTAYPTRAIRPMNSVLSLTALGATFGIVPRPWQASLSNILDTLVGKVV